MQAKILLGRGQKQVNRKITIPGASVGGLSFACKVEYLYRDDAKCKYAPGLSFGVPEHTPNKIF